MCRLRLFYECSDGSMGFAEHVMRYEDDIAGFIKHWKTGGRMVITEHIDLVQRKIMKMWLEEIATAVLLFGMLYLSVVVVLSL